MNIIVKYKVEKTFKDKYTKEQVKKDDVIDITIDRMKELNEKLVGRAVDVLVIMDNDEKTQEETDTKSTEQNDEKTQEEQEKVETNNVNVKFTKEELDAMTVNQLKELAEKNGIELTKAKKTEIIEEIMSK